MKSFFTSEFFAANRSRLRTLFTGTAPIVLTAHGLVQRNADTPYRFRQDSNFWYLTGLTTPGALLVLDKDQEVLILPEMSPTDEVFGAPMDFEVIRNISGVANIMYMKEGWSQLARRLKKVKHVATLSSPPAFVDHYGFYVNPARRALIKKIQSENTTIELLDLREHLAKMRIIKQKPELAALQEAITITLTGLEKVEKKLQNYGYEYEVEADLSHHYRFHGAFGHAFGPIVAGGKNTCHLHYEANTDSLRGVNLLYIDTGAEVEHYSADITRTYLLRASKREEAVVKAVREVADFALQNLKPGISVRDNEKVVETFMGEKLRELGLIKSITRESVRRYYTHACSHYLGLDTHDVGDYDVPLAENMVLTVEPGIYIPEEGIGVRIEDDVLITKTGVKVLSKNP